MALTLLQRELEHWDPLTLGFSPKGFAGGVECGLGLCGWMHRCGVHFLYRGVGSVAAIDYEVPVGCTPGTAAAPGTIRTYATYPFASSTKYWMNVAAVGPGGAEEERRAIPVLIETDGDGVPIAPAPKAPARLRVVPRAGGYMLITWEQNDDGADVVARSWRVYHDNGTGSMIGTPLGSTSRRAYLAGPYSNGQMIAFRVRSVSQDGAEDSNTDDVTGEAVASGPDDLGEPTVAAGVEE